MHLYNFTVQPPTAITQAITGSFSAAKQQEILVSKGKTLELFQQGEKNKLHSICSQEVFGIIRCMVPFRLTGTSAGSATKDYVVIGSDSGRIVILEFDNNKCKFVKVHQETFGKTGCRRIVPGQYLAVDPKGRAVMIGAIEKQKFVYVLNRDTQNRLTISSPLEAHKSHTVVYSMIAVDVGFENPNFACIELDHSESDSASSTTSSESIKNLKKMLTFYELDLGLNHVVKKYSTPVDRSAHYLLPVPGGSDGPGGVLVASENYLTYKNIDHPDVKVPIPRRQDMPYERGLMIISSSFHRKKNMFFFMLQSEMGDLYKVTLDMNDGLVSNIVAKYFDTIPISNSICVMRTGFLFVASEFGNHVLYQFKGLGEGEDCIVASMKIEEGDTTVELPLFVPRSSKNPKNLERVQTFESLAPIIDMQIKDLFNEGAPQFYCLCGRGPGSSLRILRHGLAVEQLAVSPLSGSASSVWTVKKKMDDSFDKYIIISFANYTMVLSIGANVEQIFDSGFNITVSTLAVGLMADDSFVQVHPNGIRTIKSNKRVIEWDADKATIMKAAINETQVVIALNGGDIIYFELDTTTGKLNEVDKKDMGQDVSSIAIGPVPSGRVRSRFLAVGFYDKTIRILSLDPDDCLNILTRQSLIAEPTSLCIAEMSFVDGSKQLDQTAFYLFIGMNNGVMTRGILDSTSGELSDTRMRFLGSKPVKLVQLKVKNSTAVFALSSRSWLCYHYQQKYHITPISFVPLDYASAFNSEQCNEGIVSITSNELRVFSIEKLGDVFNHTIIPLKYTPRKFIIHPNTKKLIIIETDHNVSLPDSTNTTKESTSKKGIEAHDDTQCIKTKPNSNKWVSYIRIYDPYRNETSEYLAIPDGEAAFSLSLCQFQQKSNELLLAVGAAKNMSIYPRKCDSGSIYLYRFTNEGKKLQLVHKTSVEDVPYAMQAFQGRLLAGVKNMLRIYDLGKKKLLRKCENKNFPNFISSITVQGDRIYVGDVAESFHFIKYKKSDNALVIFADDVTPRWLTASCQLDYDTMAGADKFGNVFVVRLPEDCTEDIEDDYSGNRWIWERGLLNGAPQKVQELAQFYVGEVITSLVRTPLVLGGPSVLVYSTVMGSIGILIPFTSKEDIEFFSLFEMQLREENTPLCGRDHLAFRSYYFPVKSVVDGDLCDQFSTLDSNKQNSIAEELERTPSEISKRLEDIRSATGF